MDIQRPDGVWIKVWPILGQVEGDIPFLAKLTNSIGHGGTHACYHCALEATWVSGANTNRYVPALARPDLRPRTISIRVPRAD